VRTGGVLSDELDHALGVGRASCVQRLIRKTTITITTMAKTIPPGITRLAPSISPPFAPFYAQIIAIGQPPMDPLVVVPHTLRVLQLPCRPIRVVPSRPSRPGQRALLSRS
jgi:hypothetical protein